MKHIHTRIRPHLLSSMVRPAALLAALSAGLSSVGLLVATVLNDGLIGMLAALIAFAASAPVLRSVLGADDRSIRS